MRAVLEEVGLSVNNPVKIYTKTRILANRYGKTDTLSVYATTLSDDSQELKLQEAEIAHATWVNIKNITANK